MKKKKMQKIALHYVHSNSFPKKMLTCLGSQKLLVDEYNAIQS